MSVMVFSLCIELFFYHLQNDALCLPFVGWIIYRSHH